MGYLCYMQRKSWFEGFFLGVVSSSAFGLIPLFTLPLMRVGLNFDSILFYRFSISAMLLGGLMVCRKENFKICFSELFPLIFLAILYSGTALFLFWSYLYISSGVATTIHYLYPILVTILMLVFFNEKGSLWTASAIVLAFLGVALLSWGADGLVMSIKGLVIVLVSVVTYAFYIVGVNKMGGKDMSGNKLSFYILLIGSFLFLCNSLVRGNLQLVEGGVSYFNIFMLSLIPTVVSNLALVYSIKNIGSTMTSILGAMEPLTAVLVGVVVFGEAFTFNVFSGMLLILIAVTLIVVAKDLEQRLGRRK